MSFAGWGGFNARVDARALTSRTVARWSGNTSTAGTTPNRAGGAVPSLLQPTSSDQPGIKTLTGGVPVLEFDGANSDLLLAPSPAFALVSPRLYWAFHVRFSDPAPLLKTVWAEWGTTERLQIALDATSVVVTVALSAVTTASASFPLPIATRLAGLFLEVFYDGNAVPASSRIRLYVGQVEVTASAFVGTLPTTLLLGNAVSNWLGSLNGISNIVMQLAHFRMLQGHPTTGERAAIALDEVPTWTFAPGDLSVANGGPLSAWLQVANATLVSGGVSSLLDALNANPATQATAGRRPTSALSGNALPVMNFDGGDSLLWPLNAANNNANQTGFAFWFKAGSLLGATAIGIILNGANSASAHKLQFQVGGGFGCSLYFTNANGRVGTIATGGLAGLWLFLTCEYDAAAATEAQRHVITVNGAVQNLTFSSNGAGGSGTLQAVTGNAILGAQGVAGTSELPLPAGSSIGPNIYAFNAKMAGASQGLLTPQARFDLMNYERPTFSPLDFSNANAGPLAAWLRLSGATLVSGDVSSIPDEFSANPATQTTAAARPTAENSANGLPCMRYAGTDLISWPLVANNNSVNQWGFGGWFKPDAVANARMIFFAYAAGGATSAHRMQLFFNVTQVAWQVYINNAAGRSGLTSMGLLSTGWQFVTFEYDKDGATEADQVVITINGTVCASPGSNIGVGGTLGALTAPTGFAFIGRDGGANPYQGLIGPNLYVLNAKMAGATQGLLTPQARAELMAYQRPT
jgi:hypothetical protein